ncbi:uncharacterized protein TNCV_4472551 [Trichonephila clavipes]|uniref:Uncharacterized protein n=1 Tax=Trichonephila clavipes TaxID=2585209 RepID=A0A8X6VFZ0_TRICX|nr:uncharacterized protein TNCV_4472551 [Trichonephila clavipes]
MLDVTKYPPGAHGFTCRNCGGGDRGRVAIYRPFGEVSLSLNRTVTCMVLKANDRRTSCPCHDEFRGPRSDYVRQYLIGTRRSKKLEENDLIDKVAFIRRSTILKMDKTTLPSAMKMEDLINGEFTIPEKLDRFFKGLIGVNGLVEGKHFNRCKRLLPLMALGLKMLHFDHFLDNIEYNFLKEQVIDDLLHYPEVIDSHSSMPIELPNNVLSRVLSAYQKFV